MRIPRQAIIWINAGVINWTLVNKLQWNINRNLYIFIQENTSENVIWKMAAILSRPQCVKMSFGGISYIQQPHGVMVYKVIKDFYGVC